MITFLSPLTRAVTAMTLFAVFSASGEECSINLSQPTLNFGRFKQEDIIASQKNWSRMPTKELIVSAFCPEPTAMALFLEATAGDRGGVMFGQKARLILVAENMVVDGHPYEFSRTTDRIHFTTSTTASRKGFIKSNEGIVAQHNSNPVYGKQMSFTLKVIPVINSDGLRRIGDTTELNSDLVWSLLTMK